MSGVGRYQLADQVNIRLRRHDGLRIRHPPQSACCRHHVEVGIVREVHGVSLFKRQIPASSTVEARVVDQPLVPVDANHDAIGTNGSRDAFRDRASATADVEYVNQPARKLSRLSAKVAIRGQGFEFGERPFYKWLMALDFWF